MTQNTLGAQEANVQMNSRSSARSTSPIVWMASAGTLLVLLLLRSQQLRGTVAAKVAETEAAKAISDAAVTELAVNVGFYLGVVLSTVLSILYFSLASIAESTFFPRIKWGRMRLRVGLLGCTAVISLLGVQLFSLVWSLPSPKDHWGTFVFVAVIGLSVPMLFRDKWWTVSLKVKTAIFAGSLATAAISLAL
jgi:hypothetical protein